MLVDSQKCPWNIYFEFFGVIATKLQHNESTTYFTLLSGKLKHVGCKIGNKHQWKLLYGPIGLFSKISEINTEEDREGKAKQE